MFNTHPTFSGVNIILMHMPRHSKICHLTFLSFANENISRRQITMYNLEKKYFHDFIVSKQDAGRRSFMKTEVRFLEGGGGGEGGRGGGGEGGG